MKKFKEEDLILYLYQECSPALKNAVDEALQGGDIELSENLNRLQRTLQQLNKLKLRSPSKASLKSTSGKPGSA